MRNGRLKDLEGMIARGGSDAQVLAILVEHICSTSEGKKQIAAETSAEKTEAPKGGKTKADS